MNSVSVSHYIAMIAMAPAQREPKVVVLGGGVGDREVHHLIHPRTGEPGGDGLLAVTVAAPDPAWSEIWSKTLFLAGRAAMRSAGTSSVRSVE